MHVGVPVIGAIVFGAALYGSVHPTPPGILKWTPYVAIVWVLLGIGVVLWLRASRPDAVGQDRLHPGRGGRHGREAAGLALTRSRISPATRSRGSAGLRWPSRPVMSSLATSALSHGLLGGLHHGRVERVHARPTG